MARRPQGALTALQREVLVVLAAVGDGEPLHGFALADRLRAGDQARTLIGHGTLYKVLNRLLDERLVDAAWEEAAIAEEARRPRRRFYVITAAGTAALSRVEAADAAAAAAPRPLGAMG